MRTSSKKAFSAAPHLYWSEIRRYLPLLFIPLILGLAVFLYVHSSTTKQIERQGTAIARHFQGQAEGILREMEIVSNTILSDGKFIEYMSCAPDAFEPGDMTQFLRSKVAETRYVGEIYVFSEAHWRVYTNKATYSYYGLPSFLREFQSALAGEEQTLNAMDLISEGWHISGENYGVPYYVQDFSQGGTGTAKLVILADLRSFLNTFFEPNVALCCAYNDSVSFSSTYFSYDASQLKTEKSVSALIGQKVKCFYEDGTDLTYLVAISTKEYYAPLTAIIWIFLAYFVAVLLFGYLYLKKISQQRYREITDIVDQLPHPTSHNPSYQDAITAVSQSMEEYKLTYDYLQRNEQRDLLNAIFVGGSHTHLLSPEQLKSIGFPYSPLGYYLCRITSADGSNLILNDTSPVNTDLTCIFFESTIGSLAGARLTVAITCMTPSYIALLSVKDASLSPDDIRALMQDTITVAENKYGLKVSVAVSELVPQASQLFEAYLETKRLSEFVLSAHIHKDVILQADMQNDAGQLLSGDFLSQLQTLSRALTMEKYEMIPGLVDAILEEHVAKLGKHYARASSRIGSVAGLLSEAVLSSELKEEEKRQAVNRLRQAATISELSQGASEIFTELSRQSQENGISIPVRQAISYIEEHLADCMLNVPMVAENTGISVQHLNRLFKKDTGNTVADYISFHRIERAQKLLSESGYTITHIAELTGYNSTATFNRNFKRYVGLSPSEFREFSKM